MSCLDYRMTRRAMMAGASASILGLNVRQLLANAGADHPAKADHVILFWNGGGMSHLDTWDPKPGRPVQGEFSPIKTSVPGIEISEIFPTFAKQMQHVALIRSIAGTQGAHARASYNMLTSYLPGPIVNPGFGSIVVHERKSDSDLPPYISISGQAPQASYLGQACQAYYVASPGDQDPYLSFPSGIAEVRGNKRLDVLAKFNKRFGVKKNNDDRLGSTQTAIDDAVKLMRSPALEAFDLTKAPQSTLDRYGDTAFGRGALLARRLVEKGVSFVQVNRGGFDTHSNNFPAMENHGLTMDPALGSLIEDLAQSGMLERTLVLMVSEFGRTPKINTNAGRDHWSKCFSCFMAGGGIRGGQVIGASDEDGMSPHERPVNVPDLHASVCHALGIDHNKEVMTPLQRPFKLVDQGEIVKELFV